ncbi:MAG: transposase [Gammaproteobacteria bacterium]|nr:transposase [Gammaproteobacteria bacterium]
MPRLARVVFAGIPHHITQRGNRREDVFFSDEDRKKYLTWLKEYCQRHDVELLAYCLMTNHVHLVAVPRGVDDLQRVLKPLHMRYAQRINRERGWKGHLWQGRFFSSPLDESYLWAAMRYVERNPVRAKIVTKAEQYAWSSAEAHCKLKKGTVLTQNPYWLKQLDQIKDWSAWLVKDDEPDKIKILRSHVEKGLPCGSEKFITKLEEIADRVLRYRPRGRPVQKGEETTLEKG